jgi:hypothetical protein
MRKINWGRIEDVTWKIFQLVIYVPFGLISIYAVADAVTNIFVAAMHFNNA